MSVDREQFKSILKKNGLKVTTQRVEVLSTLAACPDKHLTAEEIYELVKTGCPEIGLATVYRTIQLLLELGLIDRINLDDGYVRYEIGSLEAKQSKHRHHHLICMNCGKVTSFEADLLDELETKITSTTGFLIVNHEVKLYGICKECGGKILEKKRKNE